MLVFVLLGSLIALLTIHATYSHMEATKAKGRVDQLEKKARKLRSEQWSKGAMDRRAGLRRVALLDLECAAEDIPMICVDIGDGATMEISQHSTEICFGEIEQDVGFVFVRIRERSGDHHRQTMIAEDAGELHGEIADALRSRVHKIT